MKINGNYYTKLQENDKVILMQGETQGGSLFYEVWLKRYSSKDYVWPNGNVTPAGTLINPSNEQFGLYAWSFYGKERAMAKYASI